MSLTKFVQSEFSKLSDPKKAVEMAAYMKTEMPFYGIQKPLRVPVYRELFKRFPAGSQEEYAANVRALWKLPRREEKYAALAYATKFKSFVNTDALPLYEELIREGAWWDFVDDIAIHLVGDVLLNQRNVVKPLMNKWIEDPDLWIRRTALIAHNAHKKQTDEEQLFDHILRCAHEKEFFIRKAIGWALREYSYVQPKSVDRFVRQNADRLSPLSIREGTKRLKLIDN